MSYITPYYPIKLVPLPRLSKKKNTYLKFITLKAFYLFLCGVLDVRRLDFNWYTF